MADSGATPPVPQAKPAQVIPPEVAKEVLGKKLEEAPAQEVLSLLIASINRTTTIGPDPETAKLMVESEKHEETCKLEAYKEHVKTRNEQNQRDHEYRILKLNKNSFNLRIILFVSVAGCIGGITLLLTGHQLIGSNVLIASALTVFNLVAGKSPFSSQE